MTDQTPDVCPKRAAEIAEKISDKITEVGTELLINEDLAMQGLVWQLLTTWLFGGTLKIARECNVSEQKYKNILNSIIHDGIHVSHNIKHEEVHSH